VPVAVSCALLPSGNDELLAATAIETRAAGETVNAVMPLIPPTVAEIDAPPTAFVAAVPAALMLTTPGAELTQLALLVRSIVLPSVYVPIALNCSLAPRGTETSLLLTAIEARTAPETVI
jgi:hypothetical protein